MVQQVLATPYLYFSYSYDLTHTLQRLHHTAPEFLKVSINWSVYHGRTVTTIGCSASCPTGYISKILSNILKFLYVGKHKFQCAGICNDWPCHALVQYSWKEKSF